VNFHLHFTKEARFHRLSWLDVTELSLAQLPFRVEASDWSPHLHMEHLSIESLGVGVERGPDIAVPELRLHLCRVCFLLTVGGKAAPQHLKDGVK
jgi:hypothetical protein